VSVPEDGGVGVQSVFSVRTQPNVTHAAVRRVSQITHKMPKNRDKNTARRDQIMDIIRDKGEVNIKDIARIITDCSEKTLQRDLISLVSEGIVKKRGERRWSTYSLR